MRPACTALLIALTGGALPTGLADTARADPYQWCAVLGGGDDLSTGCYYLTLQQCQASVAGNGGFARTTIFTTASP